MIYEPTEVNIRAAADAIRRGELVAFPTETVYGLGADATNEEAVKKIFALKGRPSFNPLIVHIADLLQLEQICRLNDSAIERRVDILKQFWPGPLTLVLPKLDSVAPSVTAGLFSVAVRIPDHKVALELISRSERPIAAPSANRSTEVSPTTSMHVLDSFRDDLPFILDGGPCRVGLESTIVSLIDSSVKILRPGKISKEDLEEVLGEPVAAPSSRETEVLAPGMLAKHYSPHTRVILRSHITTDTELSNAGLILFKPLAGVGKNSEFRKVVALSPTGDLDEVAAHLFSTLREFDREGFDLIVIDTCEVKGIGAAIMDRVSRASAKEEETRRSIISGGHQTLS